VVVQGQLAQNQQTLKVAVVVVQVVCAAQSQLQVVVGL
jgi:hypothetical protein